MSTKQSVTVLGKTFNSEEERREYFRAELRRKLPDLKKMEGFPIGEDEDIIKLSDPPYYTACQNPWLNDFISEWNKNKDKRYLSNDSTDLNRPYASDVSQGRSNPIYMAHSYHTKVPHTAIMRYLMYYTNPGDIIFDGFAGTGMTSVAADACGNSDQKTKIELEREFSKLGYTMRDWGYRKAIVSDLSPAATFLSRNFNTVHDVDSFIEKTNLILDQLEPLVDELYSFKHSDGRIGKIHYVVWSEVYNCTNCGHEFDFFTEGVDKKTAKFHKKVNCPNCNYSHNKNELEKTWETKVDPVLKSTQRSVKYNPVLINYSVDNIRSDKILSDVERKEYLDKANQINLTETLVPIQKLPIGYNTNQPIKANGIEYIHQFYSERNLKIISEIYDRVKGDLALMFWLTSSLTRLTKMYKYVPTLRNGELTDRRTGTVSGTLYVPSIYDENNPLMILKSKIRSISKAFRKIKSRNVGYVGSAVQSNIADNSIDYIFTDPPFGSNLMYSELNLIWESWLKVRTENKTEAIENKFQGKSLFDYQNLMTQSFQEFYRLLKPNKWMTIEFSNTSASVWNTIQNAIQKAGFVVANVAALDKQQGSFKSVSTVTAVKQDLVISCYKPPVSISKIENLNNLDKDIWDFIYSHLEHLAIHATKNNSTTAIIERSPKILFDRLIAFYVQRNLPVPIDAGAFQKGLRERFIERDGMFFTNEQVQQYDKKKAENPEFVQLSILVSSEQDGVLWLKNLLSGNPSTYQDIHPEWMQALAGVRKGDILPELATILEENFLKDEAGRWYVPDPENEADLEKLRTKRLLKQFQEYKEQASKPKGKIKEARVEALRAGFKQCYQDKDFKSIISIGDRIPNNLLMEDEVLLQFYDIASSKV